MSSDQDRQQAEKNFKQQELVRLRRKAMVEYEVQALAARPKDRAFESASISQGSRVRQKSNKSK